MISQAVDFLFLLTLETRVHVDTTTPPRRIQSRTPSIRGAFERGYGVGARGGTRGGARLRVSRKAPRRRRSAFAPGNTRARGRAVRRRAGRRRAASALRPHVRDRRGRGCRSRSLRCARSKVARYASREAQAAAWREGYLGRVRRARGVRARGAPPHRAPRREGALKAPPARRRAPRDGLRTHGVPRETLFTKRSTRPASARWCTAGTRGRGGGQGEVQRTPRWPAAAAFLDARLAGTNFPARSAGERTPSGRARDPSPRKP